jgi:hypothetical protein
MPAETMRVEIVYALAQQAWTSVMELPIGATASDAVMRSDFASRVPGFDLAMLGYAIFGKTISASTVLRDGDRLELLRPLVADPKQARRQRAERKG